MDFERPQRQPEVREEMACGSGWQALAGWDRHRRLRVDGGHDCFQDDIARHARLAARGYLHCGPTGAGRSVRMVHNGIEYGLMAACAEGLNIPTDPKAGQKAAEDDFQNRVLSAKWRGFGGHAEKP